MWDTQDRPATRSVRQCALTPSALSRRSTTTRTTRPVLAADLRRPEAPSTRGPAPTAGPPAFSRADARRGAPTCQAADQAMSRLPGVATGAHRGEGPAVAGPRRARHG